MQPLCFVLMPFGKKTLNHSLSIDFDTVYSDLIKPSIMDAGYQPLRADEEQTGGVIHKALFERLVLCDYAIADLTTANANVFYELGFRHAIRPWATLLLFAENCGQLPFDVKALRALPYSIDPGGKPSKISSDIPRISRRIASFREQHVDSPAYQLLEGYPDVKRLKTDVFRDRVIYSEDMKRRLLDARRGGKSAVASIGNNIDVATEDAGVIVDLFLSYRAVSSWESMISLFSQMPPHLSATVMIREQTALALNRIGKWHESEKMLLELIAERGGSSETYGILGRVYKDRWEEAARNGDPALSVGYLNKSIESYIKGFNIDWRDAYPGINAVTMMELQEYPDSRQKVMIPVVAFAISRRIELGHPDYWDYASYLELSVLSRSHDKAEQTLAAALVNARESWETETTARNIRLIRKARCARGEDASWLKDIEEALARCKPTGN